MRWLFLLAVPALLSAQSVSCPQTVAPGATFTCTASSSVAWSKPSGSVAIFTPITATSVSGTAPNTTIYASHQEGGCPIFPNDSVFSTPITSLPVHSSSAAWLAGLSTVTLNEIFASWEPSVIDNSSGLVVFNPQYYYSTTRNGTPITIAGPTSPTSLSYPTKREWGSTWGNLPNAVQPLDFGNDHHQISINASNCNIVELYNNRELSAAAAGNTALCNRTTDSSACTAVSEWAYNGYGYVVPGAGTGTTLVSGMPAEALTLQYDELAAAANAVGGPFAVQHAIYLAAANGYIQSGLANWPATTPGGYGGTNVPPVGAWFRLKSAYTPSGTCGNECQSVVKTLQQYGGIMADGSVGFAMDMGMSIYSHADSQLAASQVQALRIPLTQFDIVDPTSLELDSSTTYAPTLPTYSPWYAANPANGYQTIANSMVVCGGTNCVPISITPVTIGFQEEYHYAVAGGSFTPKLYINGTSTTPTYAVASCSAGSGNCGTFIAGVYTAPASVTYCTQLTATLTATIGTAVANLYLTIVAAPTSSQSLGIHLGGPSTFTASDGTCYLGSPTYQRYVQVVINNAASPYPSNFSIGPNSATIPNYQLYQYEAYADNDIVIGPIHGMTPGNYNVKMYFGQGGGGFGGDCDSRKGATSYHYYDPSNCAGINLCYLEANGVIAYHDFNFAGQANKLCFQPIIATVPMTVASDGIGLVALRASEDPKYPCDPYNTTSPFVAAIEITPVSGMTPGIAIDTEEQANTVPVNGTLQFFDVPQWIGPTYNYGNTTWVVNGPGSINSLGLYSAPLGPPQKMSVPVTITATNSGSAAGTVTASKTVTIVGPQWPAN